MIIDDDLKLVIHQSKITRLCPDLRAMAQEVHRQIDYDREEVDLWAIAEALGIREFRRLPEIGSAGKGAWVHDLASGLDLILLEERLGYIRSRWTLAHEIAHILIPHHDVAILGTGQDQTPNPIHEAEADELAQELIFPESEVLKYCQPFLHMNDFIDGCLSLEVTLWEFLERAADISPIPFAAIKCESSTVTSQLAGPEFPELSLRKGDVLPLCRVEEEMYLSLWDEAFPSAWLKVKVDAQLSIQTLWQDFDQSITILALDVPKDPNLQYAPEWEALAEESTRRTRRSSADHYRRA